MFRVKTIDIVFFGKTINGHSCMDIEYVMQIVLAQPISCPNQLLKWFMPKTRTTHNKLIIAFCLLFYLYHKDLYRFDGMITIYLS